MRPDQMSLTEEKAFLGEQVHLQLPAGTSVRVPDGFSWRERELAEISLDDATLVIVVEDLTALSAKHFVASARREAAGDGLPANSKQVRLETNNGWKAVAFVPTKAYGQAKNITVVFAVNRSGRAYKISFQMKSGRENHMWKALARKIARSVSDGTKPSTSNVAARRERIGTDIAVKGAQLSLALDLPENWEIHAVIGNVVTYRLRKIGILGSERTHCDWVFDQGIELEPGGPYEVTESRFLGERSTWSVLKSKRWARATMKAAVFGSPVEVSCEMRSDEQQEVMQMFESVVRSS